MVDSLNCQKRIKSDNELTIQQFKHLTKTGRFNQN
jgi:hypothetical protein